MTNLNISTGNFFSNLSYSTRAALQTAIFYANHRRTLETTITDIKLRQTFLDKLEKGLGLINTSDEKFESTLFLEQKNYYY
jgi:hypothetical protein